MYLVSNNVNPVLMTTNENDLEQFSDKGFIGIIINMVKKDK